jgi:O-antigen/teichoic acid export membrane protein
LLVFATATGFALLGAAAIVLFARKFDSHTLVPLYFACVALPFYALTNMLDSMARSYNAVSSALLPQFVLRPILLIAVLGAIYGAGRGVDAAAAMAAFAFATWTMALVQLIMVHRLVVKRVTPGPRVYHLREWIATSLPIIAVWAFFNLLAYTDVLVLRHFRPAEDVAQYFAAAKTLALVAFIYFSVAATVGHRFTSYHITGDRAGLAHFVRSTIQWTFWPSLAATVLILALGKPILWLFGPTFVAGYPLMYILAIGLVARATVGPAERVLNMLGEQRLCALVYGCAFAVNLVAAIVLAPRLGGVGAAIATSAAIVVESVLLFVVAKWRLGMHLFIWQPRAG